ncbi:GTPase domain-containing protein [Herbidospora cretacea]|uniref:GTPase domain-containing protein n=1 Tax=Herbidospora cretacea TaxID=28444 RepID=UPI0012F88C51|nr:GTPase domain-containing protein [Herbidospora cretacea]
MSNSQELRDELARVLISAERWLDSLRTAEGIPGGTDDLDADVRTVHGLRTRALSSLLNVGLLGRFSSGKSFLISGLQKGLEYVLAPDGSGGHADKYVGILPSAPTTTTACPSTVVPVDDDPSVDASGKGLLRVRFSGDPTWHDIGTDLPPAVVASYGAVDGDLANRHREHWDRVVLEIQLLISNAPLPAKLYDLPGAETREAGHERIMRQAWAEADCFLYVSQATAVLSVHELNLIRDLYNHHLQSGKRVIWVLTGIDRALQLGNDNRPAWRATLDQNNAYLREHFGSPTGGPSTFIGEGFVPVSPAFEAQGVFEETDGSTRRGLALQENSRMGALRDLLNAMIEEGAGQRHLAQIADETRAIIRRRLGSIADVLATHRVPVDDLMAQRADLLKRLDLTVASAQNAADQLTADLDRRVREVERLFKQLPRVLHQQIDELVESGNLTAEHINQIDRRYLDVLNEWMRAPGGPATRWEQEISGLIDSARAILSLELRESGAGSLLVQPEPLELDQGTVPRDGRRTDTYTLLQTVAGATSALTVLGGAATWVMTGLSLVSVALPVGVVVTAATGTALAAKALRDRKSTIERARSERIAQLDEQAEQERARVVAILQEQGLLILDAVDMHIGQYRARLQATLQEIGTRIEAPDMVASARLVDRLEPFEMEANSLIAELLKHAPRGS